MSVQSSSSTPHFSLCMISVIHAMSTGQHPVHRSSHYFTSRLVLSLLGHKMTDLPLEPQLAKMLLISPEYSCSNEVQRVGPLPLLCTLLLFLFSTLFCSVLLFFSLPFLFSSLLFSTPHFPSISTPFDISQNIFFRLISLLSLKHCSTHFLPSQLLPRILEQMLSIVAMLSSASIFMRPREAAKQVSKRPILNVLGIYLYLHIVDFS